MQVSKIEQLSSEKRLELLVSAVVDYALYLLNPSGVVVSWNPGAERLKGYSADEIVGQHFSRFYTDADRESGLPGRILEAAAQAGRFESEGWRVRKDGSRFWALAVVDPIRGDDNELLGFVKITRDMTERREAHQRLIESEAKFRHLVQGVIDYAIFYLDEHGIVSSWNLGAQRIKGYAPEEIIGSHFSRFYTDEDKEAGIPEKALRTARVEGRFEAEGWRVRKDGTRFFASVVIDAIKDASGFVTGFAKVTRDITERMEAAKALKQAQEQLAASQKLEAVGQLSGGIAHDFNNLLMVILGNLETLQRRMKNETAAIEKPLKDAMRGAQRAVTLTQRLLAFSRRQALSPVALDLNKFIVSAADFLSRALGETIEIETVGSAGLWTVEADPNQLEVALLNLAINARDAMPSGGKLTIEASNVTLDRQYVRENPEASRGQYVLICVSDTGVGMDAETASRAFEPFFTTKEVGHGTGLGLSQVYGFVKQSGGNVKIYSEPGLGTTIKLYFPRHFGVGQDETNLGDATPEASASGETILVVEDSTEVRDYIASTLRELGYNVIVAATPGLGLDLLSNKARTINLLLTDVVMPGLNGRELARAAQAMRPDLKVIYMTGYSRNAVVHQGRLDPTLEVLQKPVSQLDLATKIREALSEI